ncbi:hypothetical protein C6353_26550 [Bacillus toyonensis]|uniref:LAGLIDADG family homing endonuclease n=1 Tax=Bacillus toyonensis TaxID=155322 RepID=UPI000D04462A|nr:LAGLIDADG family homing endonuclease [Bacillus toyonensis]PRT14044.1 hypothetical protein C6353_26550 [Bacillus toyonensis]
MPAKRFTAEIEKEIAKRYENGEGPTELGRIYGIDRSTVRIIAQRNGVYKNMSESKRKYQLDINFFDNIDTEEKAYWLGFIAADGTIKGEKNTVMDLVLQAKDVDMLEMLKMHLNYNAPIHKREGVTKNGKQFYARGLRIMDKHVCERLAGYGIVKRKQSTVRIPQGLDKEMIRHFIRGYFDGDGSIGEILSPGKITPQKVFSVTGNELMISDIRGILVNECDLKANKLKKDNRSKHTYSLHYGGNKQILKIYEFLYKNASVFMLRKKLKFER